MKAKRSESGGTLDLASARLCPGCGLPLVPEGGCDLCRGCGYSPCP